MSSKENAILVGPFIGELWWEMFHFVGHIIYQKYKNPKTKIIVLTRPNRFDLYGRYCDILIPLKIVNERDYTQDCFTMKNFSIPYYESIVNQFLHTYEKKYTIKQHIYPNISPFYNLKWQYPRSQFVYNFKPRMINRDITNKIYSLGMKNLVATDIHDLFELSDCELVNVSNFVYELKRFPNAKITELGCLIELIKACRFFVGNMQSITSRLALLLGIPLIAYNETYEDSEINIISKTPVFKCTNIEEGILNYESYIRSQKDRTRK